MQGNNARSARNLGLFFSNNVVPIGGGSTNSDDQSCKQLVACRVLKIRRKVALVSFVGLTFGVVRSSRTGHIAVGNAGRRDNSSLVMVNGTLRLRRKIAVICTARERDQSHAERSDVPTTEFSGWVPKNFV